MKKAKKLLVTLLVLTFVMSMFNVGFAQEEEKLPSEVVRAQALGILKGDDQGNLNLDQPITRAEALALIVRISGLEKSADLMAGQTQFADVNAAPNLQWATGYINLGVGQEIVNGYPDGTFKGSNQVTYAEMAKMLLYAMNYGVTVEGGQWPAAVMGKADDLGVFDKVNALPNVPALRGDVVMMIDNSLTINHLVQTGYGDLKQYEEGDASFLSKMDVDELEDVRVTEIARVNDKLDDDEIELTEYDKDGKVVDSDIYTLIADVDPEEIFGLEVDAWVNDDDEVFFVKVTTSEKDILFDTVDYEESDDEEITLKDADKTYDWDGDAVAYVNFKEVKLEDIGENAYGKIVLDRGDVAFANLFEFNNVGVVTEVEDNIIEFIDDETNEEEIDLDDYDDIYVYNPDFSKADVEDIDVDSAIFFWEGDDDDIYIIVKNEVVEGEVERVKVDKIKVDGEEYSKGSYAIFTLDKGDNYEVWADLEDVEDFVDEEVMLVLDLRGRVLLVTGSAKATSGNLYGIVTYAKDGRYVDTTIFNQEGEEVDYTAESSTEFRDSIIDITGLKYYKTGADLSYAALKYKLTSDSEIAEDKSVVAVIKNGAITGSYDYESKKVAKNNVVFEGELEKKADKKFIELDDEKFYISDDTIIMKALNDDGELDPQLISVDRFVSIGIAKDTTSAAVVFGEDGKDADFIVMLHKDFEGTEEDYLYGVVTDKPYKSGGSYYATINVFGEGEEDYKIDTPDDFQKGDVVAFDFNNKDEAVLKSSYVFEGTLTEYDDGYITVTGDAYGTYKVDSAAVLYNDDDGLDKKISRSKLKDYEDKKIVFAVEDRTVVAAIVYDEAKVPDAKVSETKLISATENDEGNVVVKYDVRKYDTIELRLYTAGDDIVDFVPSFEAAKNEASKTATLEADANGIHYVKLYVDGKEVGSKLVKVTKK